MNHSTGHFYHKENLRRCHACNSFQSISSSQSFSESLFTHLSSSRTKAPLRSLSGPFFACNDSWRHFRCWHAVATQSITGPIRGKGWAPNDIWRLWNVRREFSPLPLHNLVNEAAEILEGSFAGNQSSGTLLQRCTPFRVNKKVYFIVEKDSSDHSSAANLTYRLFLLVQHCVIICGAPYWSAIFS